MRYGVAFLPFGAIDPRLLPCVSNCSVAAQLTPKEWLSQQCVATDRSEKHCDEVNERALACERSNAFRQRLGQKVTHESHS